VPAGRPSGGGFAASVVCPLSSVPTWKKATLLRIGLRVTRHPRMGAVEQPEVAVWELSENKRLIGKTSQTGPAADAAGANEAPLTFFSGTVGIDEEDHAVQHVEGRFLADVKSGGGIIKIRKGTRVTIENTRVAAGIWLLSRLEAWGEARYFAFELNGNGNIFAGNYRKFHSTSRILPGFTEGPADSRTPSTSERSHSPVVPH
jgi:hypothetical protein